MAYRPKRAFALPTILIASVVMISVLIVAVVSTSAVRLSLNLQYYDQLSQVASDAGVAYARSCLSQNSGVPQWSDANPLRPNTDCTGTQIVGFTCPENTIDQRCSVMVNGNAVGTFTVGMPIMGSDAKAYSVNSKGTLKVLRSSDGSIWRQYIVNNVVIVDF